MFNDDLNKGMHTFNWDGRNDSNQHLASGNYIVVAQSETQVVSLKLSFIK